MQSPLQLLANIMRYSSTVLALFAGIVASNGIPREGITVPANAADGVYSVRFDSNGTAIHELIAPPLSEQQLTDLVTRKSATLKQPSRIAARADGITCENYGLDSHNDCDAAVQALKNQCDPSGAIGSRRSFYSKAGGVVAYVCNFSSSAAMICDHNKIGSDYGLITATCGLYKAGWRTEGTGSTGYERENSNFCGWGT